MVLLANIAFLEGQPSGEFIIFLFGAIVLVGAAAPAAQPGAMETARASITRSFISLSAMQLTILFHAAALMVRGVVAAPWATGGRGAGRVR